MEWLEESITKSTREIQSNSVAETEQILERHEKNLDQLDKKKKVFMDQKGKGEKLLNDPKAPKFLNGHMERLVGLWKEANNKGEDRLEDLKNNLVAWEAYENKRNQLDGQLNEVSFVLLFFTDYSAVATVAILQRISMMKWCKFGTKKQAYLLVLS